VTYGLKGGIKKLESLDGQTDSHAAYAKSRSGIAEHSEKAIWRKVLGYGISGLFKVIENDTNRMPCPCATFY